ncbi:MAG: hypothetical protein IPM55_04830 [Acidobacteria bacterium]|nr:hypothetical protein [Acidobacteriota bacterium]
MTGYGKERRAEIISQPLSTFDRSTTGIWISTGVPPRTRAARDHAQKQVQAAISRGRVDVNIIFSQTSDTVYELNRPLIRGYLRAQDDER